jgi:hypothetical protein
MCTRTVTSIFFDGQFWVAEVERHCDCRVEVARHCFGPEPSNAELLDWVDHEFPRLRFHVREEQPAQHKTKRPNPKRMRRIAAAEMGKIGFSSKADETMKSALEEQKKSKRSERRARSEDEQDRQWALRQKKLKERRRGH